MLSIYTNFLGSGKTTRAGVYLKFCQIGGELISYVTYGTDCNTFIDGVPSVLGIGVPSEFTSKYQDRKFTSHLNHIT